MNILYGSCNKATTKGASNVCIIWKSRRHKIYTNFSFVSLNMKYWLLLLATKFMKLAMLLCPHKVILMFCPQTPSAINDGLQWQLGCCCSNSQPEEIHFIDYTRSDPAANSNFRKLNWKRSRLLLQYTETYNASINLVIM